jgi:ribosomal protection tetracycline resistance protein
LHVALTQLAEQDPLIDLRQDDVRQEMFLSLYGEVQKEVIQETLATDFGIDVDFRGTTTICAERLIGTGAAVEILGERPNPFRATVGLRVAQDVLGSGVTFRLEVELGSMPLAFFRAVEDTVQETLREGLCGWQVLDCVVTMTHAGYSPPSSTARDFRLLTPLILMSALKEAGTVVCEPIHRFRLEAPADTIGRMLSALARLDAAPEAPEIRNSAGVVEGDIPAARVHALRLELPALTRGEGVLECEFGRYEPVDGTPPTRPRSDWNPLNREEYLLRVASGGRLG